MTREEFIELYKINVNEKVEKKNGLNYLSWSYARAEFKKVYPNATYEIKMFDNKPYIFDENLGYMVFTSVKVGELEHEMRLPVMDGSNKAMKNTSYTYKVKGIDKTIQPATMFDINKTIMRCLTKNLAMFGLGLYIYNGEDLPEEQEKEKPIFGKENWEKFTKVFQNYKNENEAIQEVEKNYILNDEYKQMIKELYNIAKE